MLRRLLTEDELNLYKLQNPRITTPKCIAFYKGLPKRIKDDYIARQKQIGDTHDWITHIEYLETLKNNVLAQPDEDNIIKLLANFRELFNLVKINMRLFAQDASYCKLVEKLDVDHLTDKEVEDIAKQLTVKDIEEIFNAVSGSYQDMINKLYEDFTNAEVAGINWNDYFAQVLNDKDVTYELIKKNYNLMREIYNTAMVLETAKFHHIDEKYKDKGGMDIWDNLIAFRKLINELEIKNIDANIIVSFRAIVTQIETELLENDACDLKETAHPAVLVEFIKVSNKLLDKPLSLVEIQELTQRLDQIQVSKKVTTWEEVSVRNNAIKEPMSPALKTKIGLAIGMLVGAIVGFAIGATVTFWGCGFGGIIGAIAGATLVQGLILGGAAAGGAVLTGIPAAILGHRHATNKMNLFKANEFQKVNQPKTEIQKSNPTSAKLKAVEEEAIRALNQAKL